MDTMSRQIATGQKVASVKDDGAAWTRAAGMRSDSVTWEGRKNALSLASASMAATKPMLEQVHATTEALRGLILSARSHPAGSAGRQRLQAEWNAIIAQSAAITSANPVLPDNTGIAGSGPTGPGHMILPNDSYFGATRISMWGALNAFHGWLTATDAWRPVVLATFDLLNANSAQLDDAHTSAMNVGIATAAGGGSFASSWLTAIGADEAMTDRMHADIDRNRDRLNTAIGSLTDTDMGKASTARANAETRQQLALATVRQAINAYGSYASGLMGNVMATRRAIA
jgi:flagellin-like hook-associated protein FlgL